MLRCPYPIINIVYGSSEILNFFVDTSFRKSKLTPKDKDANIWSLYENVAGFLCEFYFGLSVVHVI